MALDALLQVITEDADAEAQRVLDSARAEAEAIRAAADVRDEQRLTEASAARETELRQELEAKRSRALTGTRMWVLKSRAKFVDRIFAAAEAELPGVLERSASPDALVRLCREALDYFPPGHARIRTRAGLARRLSGVPLGVAEVVTDDTVPEGVIVESPDGRSRVDNTLVARLQRRRTALAIALLAAAPEGE
jgi:vacuolar-type H+-ATPase subunit E/Vma4